MLRWTARVRRGAAFTFLAGIILTAGPARAEWILDHSWTEELPLIIEAEQLDDRHGSFTVTSTGISHDWATGHWAKYEVNVTAPGTYFALINASSFYPTTYCKLSIYQGASPLALANIDVPQTGSPFAWAESAPVSFDLTPGTYFIRAENTGNLPYAWDYMKVWAVPEPMAAFVVLTGGVLLMLRRRA